MMQRISVLLLVILSFLSFLSTAGNFPVNPADSLRVKSIHGKNFILHKVEPKETWTLLSKRYNVSVDELMQANQGVEMLKIDQIVNIPLQGGTASAAPAKTELKKETPVSTSSVPLPEGIKHPVTYVVQSGETLFGIARKFNQPVENIKAYNNLRSDNIQAGQKLIVNYNTEGSVRVLAQTETQKVVVPPPPPAQSTAEANIAAKPAEVRPELSVPVASGNIKESNTVTEPRAENYFDQATKTVTPVKKGNSGKSMLQITETGVATLFTDGNMKNSKFYGLHRTAPIGTIIKVTNRMNNQFVYVKIVGLLPDTGENDNVIIKMSQAVSEKLNALDKYFQVELSYGMTE